MKIGIIGCGIITREAHVPAILKMGDKIDVIALCNRSLPKAEKTAELLNDPTLPLYTSWHTMIEKEPDLEAVLVSLPIPLNYPVSRDCVAAGLNVLCEKPAGINGSEAELTLELNRDKGPYFMTAENFQFHPGMLKAVELIHDDLIGELHSLQWNVFQFMKVDNKFNQTEWRNHNAYPGGYVMDGGVHFIHALQMLAGPVISVIGKTGSINPRLGTMDMGFALLTHKSGAVSSLNMGWQHGSEKEPIKIFGRTGSLIIKETEVLHLDSEGTVTSCPVDEDDSFYGEWLDFYQVITDKKEPELSQQTAVRDVKVIEALIRSQEEGGEVFLD